MTSETLKEIHLAGDIRSIISRIIKLGSKSKIKLECVHVKTNNNKDNVIENKVLELVLKWDAKVKE